MPKNANKKKNLTICQVLIPKRNENSLSDLKAYEDFRKTLKLSNALGIPRTYFLLDTIVLVYLEENSYISTGYLSANQYTILHPIIIR